MSKVTRIVLEGNECNFKTTIAEKLKEKLGFEIVKGTSFEIATAENEKLYEHCKKVATMENVIIDRFIHSNYVYASLYPHYTMLTKDQFNALDWYLKQNDENTIVAYLYASTDVLKERIRVRGDEHINENRLEDINNLYDALMGDGHCDPYFFDTSVMDSEYIAQYIVNIIKNRGI